MRPLALMPAKAGIQPVRSWSLARAGTSGSRQLVNTP